MSQTIIARRVRSNPFRTASETWQIIVNLSASDKNSDAHKELMKIGGIAANIISAETPKDSPIVFHGSGPMVRFYCLYDEDAITGDNSEENPLAQSPTTGEWKLSLPCPEEDMDWIQKKLNDLGTTHVSIRVQGENVQSESSEPSGVGRSFSINEEVFRSL